MTQHPSINNYKFYFMSKGLIPSIEWSTAPKPVGGDAAARKALNEILHEMCGSVVKESMLAADASSFERVVDETHAQIAIKKHL